MIYTERYRSPLGDITLAADGSGIIGLWFEGQKYFERGIENEEREDGSSPALDSAVKWLDRYFAGEKPSPKELQLSPRGSVFQKVVWRVLCGIPWGKTITYGDIAGELSVGRKTSPRAVGSAVGRNPISIIIPCHRVVGADGGLTGYAGGIERKSWLLEHEGARNEHK